MARTKKKNTAVDEALKRYGRATKAPTLRDSPLTADERASSDHTTATAATNLLEAVRMLIGDDALRKAVADMNGKTRKV